MKGFLNKELGDPKFQQSIKESIKSSFNDSSMREKLAALIDAKTQMK